MIINNAEYDLSKIHGNFYWRGWSIVKFTPSFKAAFSPSGVWHNGRYGFEEVFEVNEEGKWIITNSQKTG